MDFVQLADAVIEPLFFRRELHIISIEGCQINIGLFDARQYDIFKRIDLRCAEYYFGHDFFCSPSAMIIDKIGGGDFCVFGD